jgi:hypothetical protein
MKKMYSESIQMLSCNADWHFNTSHASAQDIKEFCIEGMAEEMKELAPDLWDILGIMLLGDKKRPPKDLDNDQIMEGDAVPNVTSQDLEDEAEQIDENGTSVKHNLDSRTKAAWKEAIGCFTVSFFQLFFVQLLKSCRKKGRKKDGKGTQIVG